MTRSLPVWAEGLEGRRACVTGASSGIGLAIAEALAAAGAEVLAVARDPDKLEVALGDRPGLRPWAADVTSEGFAEELEGKEIDILVNNAGVNVPLPITEVTPEILDRMLTLNVRSTYLASQAVARSMLTSGTQGVIINITSQMGHVGSPRRTVYCMTKHALEGLTKALAVELAPAGIRVNSVAPTFIETPMTRPMFEDPAFKAFAREMIPLGRIGTPEDVAAAVVYLASPAANLITGTSLLVDGGWTAR
jgi:NAD(P)-dependent dehydrogenase (short-subunit alcohol dehydrogenase family)